MAQLIREGKYEEFNRRVEQNGGADLSYSFLRMQNLAQVNLEGASLKGAYLRGANLRGKDLTDVDLEGASICGANCPSSDNLGQMSGLAKGVSGPIEL